MIDQQVDKLIIDNYGAKNLSKVKRNMKSGVVESRRRFAEKYPRADFSKFEYQVDLDINGDISKYTVFYKVNDVSSYDITSNTFLNNEKWVEHLGIWPKLWDVNGTIQPYVANPVGTQYKINSFRVYVTNDLFFDASMEDFNIDAVSSDSVFSTVSENPYLAAIYAAYIATYYCGICTKHFEYNANTPNIITSIARYHLYYTIKRFIRNPDSMRKFITADMSSIISKSRASRYVWSDKSPVGEDNADWWEDRHPVGDIRNAKIIMTQAGIKHQPEGGTISNAKIMMKAAGIKTKPRAKTVDPRDGYKYFIATESDGLTKTGQLLLQHSIESYVYCVLGAQARTRWPIVGRGAMSIQTQSVFLKLVSDTVVQAGHTVAITNMRRAIKDTNVILNMVISPGMLLTPSNMIILTEMVSGYNNILTLAGKGMKFGVNSAVNYTKSETEDTASGDKTVTDSTSKKTPIDTTTIVSDSPTNAYETDLYLLIVALAGGVLISKYVI